MTGRYKAYPEYKDAGVEWLGEIPIGWSMWKLAHAYNEIGSGTTPPTSNEEWFNGNVPWVTTGELREKIITNTKKKLSDEALNTYPTLRKHPVGSIAIAMYGATIGRLGIFGVEATTNQACCVMGASKQIKNKYLFYWLLAFKEDIIRLSSGGGQPNINQEKVASLKISAPEVTEQQKIANFLDHETAKIDTLIAKQEKLIELLKEKRQAVISHAVTKGISYKGQPEVPMKDSGVEWLGEVPEHWDVSRLKYLVSEPLLYGANEAALETNSDNPRFIRITDVRADGSLKEDTFRSLPQILAQPYMLTDGDILLARSGGTVGKSFIYRDFWGKCCFAGYLIKASIDSRKISADWVYFNTLTTFYWEWISSSQIQATIQNVSAEKYNSFAVAIPPEYEVKEIIKYLNEKCIHFDKLVEQASTAIELMKERKTALISAVVTGKIDVRDWQPKGVQG
ncbi:restriction endonuclease subunit S [Shewanella sp. MF05960]|uniref:restriction endonuclease subunit S n=1 Tax=Shewanella sp. MF05960 TaxID=3434874 RepID=UPI003D7AB2BC